ncbi:MAG: TRAP transporter small permease [Tissierellia bacterium]|nr:TRAP transporter small permease [Tissierellia bacterium]
MKAIIAINEIVNKISRYLLILMFAAITVIYTSQIISRYFFSSGLHWSEEFVRYVDVAMVMLGSAVLARGNGHVNVSALESVTPEDKLKYLVLVQNLLTITFFGIAIFLGLQFMNLAGTQISTNMRLPMKMVYSIFPISFVVLVFNAIMFILVDLFKIGKEA